MKALGALGKSEGLTPEELNLKIDAAKSVASNVKLRTRFARLTQDLRRENDYSSDFLEAKMEEKLNQAVRREMEKYS